MKAPATIASSSQPATHARTRLSQPRQTLRRRSFQQRPQLLSSSAAEAAPVPFARAPANEPPFLQQVARTYVRLGRRTLSYFSGCDYFRMASHPRVMAALTAGVRRYGLNVAASRLTTGNHALYHELERRLATFFAARDALLVPNGYLGNLVVAQALAGSFSHALIDETAHPSLADAARFLDCPVLRFQHCSPADLAAVVRRCGPQAKLVVLTDGLFPADGSIAPLQRYLRALPGDALLLVDDAHGAGVLGRTGKGSLELAGIGRRRVVQTLTLSKAFGVYGGAILGTPALRRRILERSRLFAGSTPLPLPLACAALASLQLMQHGRELRTKLTENAACVKDALRTAGVAFADHPGPILALQLTGARAIANLQRALLAANIYPPFICYPGGPAGGGFRFVISSAHTRQQLDRLIAVLIHAVLIHLPGP